MIYFLNIKIIWNIELLVLTFLFILRQLDNIFSYWNYKNLAKLN